MRSLRVSTSQSRAPPSSQPVRRVLPSGLNAAALMQPGCGKGWPRGVLVATSHTCAEPLAAAGDKGLAVGAEGPGIDRFGLWNGFAEGRPGQCVPEPYRPIFAPGHDRLAIGTECHHADLVLVLERLVRWAFRWPCPTAAPSCRRCR